jgi:glucokinase
VILAGDVGGTNCRLALFERGSTTPLRLEVHPTGVHPTLEALVSEFLGGEAVEAACFGIAGPVREGRYVAGTNLAWPIDGVSVAAALGLPFVRLLNDLEANALGIPALAPDDFVTLNEGDAAATGNAAVVSAGTGLGVAGLFWDGQRHHAFATEGGHVDWGPRTETERALLAHLATQYEHVSAERVCSGLGLENVHAFLGGEAATGAEIAAAAAAGDPVAERTLDLFVSAYGAVAGNVAVTLMATGGVYLGGGIAPKLLDRLQEGAFMEAFAAKGRMRPLLERIPVRVILNDKTALLGAARTAGVAPVEVPA